ncbi:MAG: group II intron reverse transcriptase domain-containing protein [Saprospiraceae bacterium]|nr:group II intron reverse transcriptase domain-containing protein [Saprospiraceae bacterium]
MKRTGGLFEIVTSYDQLLKSYRKARSGTRKTDAVCAYGFHLENNLLELRRELLDGEYHPRPYRYFELKDPKRRTIAVADFKDRVVHHAVVGALEPVFERLFIHDSYATRKGKGAHSAVFQAQRYLRRSPYFLKTDIEKYFDSIDHGILLNLIERKIKDKRLVELISRILANGGRSGVGLPIGNLTSQFFANVYLNGFDQWIKETKREPYYIRYMDDFVIFSNEKTHLKSLLVDMKAWLDTNLNLRLKPGATFMNISDNGLSFLGTRIFPALIRIHPENARRASQKLLKTNIAWKNGDITDESYFQSLNSYDSYFSVYGTREIKKIIFENL